MHRVIEVMYLPRPRPFSNGIKITTRPHNMIYRDDVLTQGIPAVRARRDVAGTHECLADAVDTVVHVDYAHRSVGWSFQTGFVVPYTLADHVLKESVLSSMVLLLHFCEGGLWDECCLTY